MASSANKTVAKLIAKNKANIIKAVFGTAKPYSRHDGFNNNEMKLKCSSNVHDAQCDVRDRRAKIDAARAKKGLHKSVPRIDEMVRARVECLPKAVTPRCGGAHAIPWTPKKRHK